MTYFLESRRKKPATLEKTHPQAAIVDVTSKAPAPWIKFSPFYPHGDIPIPFSAGYNGQSVEGIWQGLKVFEAHDVDVTKFEVTSMKGLKRTERRFGKTKGHRQGVHGAQLLSYREARYQIYLPCYRWVLDRHLQEELQGLRDLEAQQDVILLDYETNSSVDDLRKPLSHAALVISYLTDSWPTR